MVWFSLCAREVPGSIPGWPKSQLFKYLTQQFHVLRKIAFFENLFEKQSAKQIIKTYKSEHYHYQLLTTFMGQCSSGMILALGARVPDSIPGCLQLGTIQIIGPNNFMFQEHCIFWEIIWKTVCKTDYEIYELEQYGYQLLTTIFLERVLVVWSSLCVREVAGAIPGCPQLVINQIILICVPKKPCSQEYCVFLRN